MHNLVLTKFLYVPPLFYPPLYVTSDSIWPMTNIVEESDMNIAWLLVGAAFFGLSAGLIRLFSNLKAGE